MVKYSPMKKTITDLYARFIHFSFGHTPDVKDMKRRARKVRPAYRLAERLDNFLKILFGLSIIFSAITATFLGFTKLGDLLNFLINTPWGRIIMLLIGVSQVLIGFWRGFRLKRKRSLAIEME